MKRGRNWVAVDIYDNNDDCILFEVLVEWEYDANGGNEACKHWFDYKIVSYSGNEPTMWEKEQIEMRMETMDIDEIMNYPGID
jgi:hypothetical protein